MILERLENIESLLTQQGILQKEVLTFDEARSFLDVSSSHLYKLTSAGEIPHFKPQGKRIYFNRQELEQWLQRNPIKTNAEIEQEAINRVALSERGGVR